MRLLLKDLKSGRIKLLPENADDLWYLYNIVEKGDKASALTQRRDTRKDDRIREKRGEKHTTYLTIAVEDVNWHAFSDMLRIRGIIVEGEDARSYHTLNIREGVELTIQKEAWEDAHLQLINEAVKRSKEPLITFVSIDDEAATIAIMRQYGVQRVAHIPSHKSGKMYEAKEKTEEFFGEVLSHIKEIHHEGVLVVLGPGFFKEDFLAYGKERAPELFSGAHLFTTAHADMQGIHEALKTGAADAILSETRVQQETAAVESLLKEIRAEGLYAYGRDEVIRALNGGAVDTLLITDEMVRSADWREILSLARENRARAMIVSTHHDAGKHLRSLGGFGALLRFRVE